MSSESKSETWLPIVDYAVLKGISTSTLRRYIKSNKIKFKVEGSRYLILMDQPLPAEKNTRAYLNWDGAGVGPARFMELEEKVSKAQEQIDELKMLVAIYEEKLAQKDR